MQRTSESSSDSNTQLLNDVQILQFDRNRRKTSTPIPPENCSAGNFFLNSGEQFCVDHFFKLDQIFHFRR